MEEVLQRVVLSHFASNLYEVSERPDGFEVVGRKGVIGMALEDVGEDYATVRFFGVNGRVLDLKVCVVLDAESVLESYCARRLLTTVKQAVGNGTAKRKKPKVRLAWFRSVKLGRHGCSGCHREKGFVSRTDGYHVVWTEDDGAVFKDVCKDSECYVGKRIAKWRKDWPAKSFAVSVKEFASCLKAMKAICSSQGGTPTVKLTVKPGKGFMQVEAGNYQGEKGRWPVQMSKKWTGKKRSREFPISYLQEYVKSTKTLAVFPDAVNEAWGFEGDVYVSALMPVVEK